MFYSEDVATDAALDFYIENRKTSTFGGESNICSDSDDEEVTIYEYIDLTEKELDRMYKKAVKCLKNKKFLSFRSDYSAGCWCQVCEIPLKKILKL